MHKKRNAFSEKRGRSVPKNVSGASSNPLSPAQSREDWEAQGWSSESVPISAANRLEATVSVRFDPDSAQLLRRAARLSGVTQSQFVRWATVEKARRTVEENQPPVTMWIPDRD